MSDQPTLYQLDKEAGLLTDTEQVLVTAARIVDAYRGKPVPWVHRATLRFAAHMMLEDNDE